MVRRWCEDRASEYNATPATVAGVVAALSPGCPWKTNLRNAESVLWTVERGGGPADVRVSTYPRNRFKAFAVAWFSDPDLARTSQKTRAFVNNISDDAADDVTIDVHAYSVAVARRHMIKTMPSIPAWRYDLIADAYRNVGARLGLRGREVQAITWVAWKRVHRIRYDNGDWMDQLAFNYGERTMMQTNNEILGVDLRVRMLSAVARDQYEQKASPLTIAEALAEENKGYLAPLSAQAMREAFTQTLAPLAGCTVQGCAYNVRTKVQYASDFIFCAACLPGQLYVPEVTEVLAGHVSEETAYLIEDHPYGRQLRCQKRMWVESKPRLGARVGSRTSNPKRANDWNNKPKFSTYAPVTVLYRNSEDHVHQASIGYYENEARLSVFVSQFGAALQSERDQAEVATLKKIFRARERVKVSVEIGDGPRQSAQERAAVIGGAIRSAERAIGQEDFDKDCPNLDRHALGLPCAMCAWRG